MTGGSAAHTRAWRNFRHMRTEDPGSKPCFTDRNFLIANLKGQRLHFQAQQTIGNRGAKTTVHTTTSSLHQLNDMFMMRLS